MSATISLDELILLIREHQCLSPRKAITASSRLEKDLGITGDDGCELLAAVEKKFAISFSDSAGSLREAFVLQEGETLFYSEPNLFSLLAAFFGWDFERARDVTVGDLHSAACRVQKNQFLAYAS